MGTALLFSLAVGTTLLLGVLYQLARLHQRLHDWERQFATYRNVQGCYEVCYRGEPVAYLIRKDDIWPYLWSLSEAFPSGGHQPDGSPVGPGLGYGASHLTVRGRETVNLESLRLAWEPSNQHPITPGETEPS